MGVWVSYQPTVSIVRGMGIHLTNGGHHQLSKTSYSPNKNCYGELLLLGVCTFGHCLFSVQDLIAGGASGDHFSSEERDPRCGGPRSLWSWGLGAHVHFLSTKIDQWKYLDETMLPMNLPQMCFVKHDPERKLKMIVIKLVWGCLSVKYSKPCEDGPHLPFIYTIWQESDGMFLTMLHKQTISNAIWGIMESNNSNHSLFCSRVPQIQSNS